MEKKKLSFSWMNLSENRNELYGIAILWIMIFHGIACCNVDYTFGSSSIVLIILEKIIKFGGCGVDLFLLLSGISLYFAFSKNQNLSYFYKRRYQRLLIPVFIINIPVWIFLFLIKDFNLPVFWMNLTFQSFWFKGDQQIWYVCAIAVFYFLYPALYHFLYDNPKATLRRYVGLTVVYIVTLIAMTFAYTKEFQKLEIALTRFPIFLLGVALGKAVKNNKELPKWFILIPIGIFVASVLFGQFGLHSLKAQNYHIEHAMQYKLVFRMILTLLGGSFTFVFAWILHLVSWKPLHVFLTFFGNISLELYISHISVQRILKSIGWLSNHDQVWRWMVTLAIAIPVAWLCAKLENCIIKQKKKA